LLDAEFWRVAQTSYELAQPLYFLEEPRLSRARRIIHQGNHFIATQALAFFGQRRVRRDFYEFWGGDRRVSQDAIMEGTIPQVNWEQESECFRARFSIK
jgi:hypothetical protein